MSGAQMRMTDALLRSVGGRTVLLHIPAPAVPGDVGEQVGLAAPLFQDVPIGPAVFRKVRAKIATGEAGKPAQYELLVSASAIAKVVGSLDYNSAPVLFALACGVLIDGKVLGITSVTSAEAFGAVYLYRLGLRAAAVDLV
jgi:hypothetical protein